MDATKLYQEEALGSRVMVRTNEPEPLMIGKVVKFEDMGHSTLIHVIQDEATGEKFLCCGVILPYNKGLEDYLNTLDPKEQWNLMKEFTQKFRAIDTLRRG